MSDASKPADDGRPPTTPGTPAGTAEQIHRLDAVRRPLGRRLSRAAGGAFDGVTRRLIHGLLRGVDKGCIELDEGGQTLRFGHVTDDMPNVVRIEVHDPRFYTSVALGGILASGESFMEGHWSCDDLALHSRTFRGVE